MNFGIIGNFYHRLGLVRTLPFMLVLAKLALRIPWVDHRAWRVVEILNTPESLRPERYIDFFKDQEDFLGIKIGWQPINFVGSDIIEFGPGPLAGWAPMALFRGASRVFGIEPNWIPGVLEDSAIEQAYLRPHYSSLVKAFGPIMSYPVFHQCLLDQMSINAVEIQDVYQPIRADIVLSNSCLEHIVNLDKVLSVLACQDIKKARQMHLVNFGNHRNKYSPFQKIYEMNPSEYRLRYGEHINLLRASDVLTSFHRSGMDVQMIPVEIALDKLEAIELHSYWQNKYEREDLAIRTALFVK